MMSFETPSQPRRTFDFEPPRTPRNMRPIHELGTSVISNLERLSTPSLNTPLSLRNESISPRGRSSEFKEALKRMRNGSAMNRLKQQRAQDNLKQEEAMQRLRALTMNQVDKGASSPTVSLGRQPPERRSSGLARSA
eukprot:CAMPEP_0176024772 /NCGR_PEP_ID=MMETSP0120_2-20121206/12110_1 /TAXON_ID=160619 /ORGANISM="Kryptoperidinium foliaceum, Strain CCMP 1326" /LENGTH=136 /DNA_ID=CAMNT_0017357953 /DNA_START=77 /DNA_END=487 /DNA_ORIENTATION=-